MRESSLDDFLDDGAGDDTVGGDSDGGDPTVGGDSDGVDPTVENTSSALTTYGWTPDGVECADCGATVERRWRDGDELVCADCKPW